MTMSVALPVHNNVFLKEVRDSILSKTFSEHGIITGMAKSTDEGSAISRSIKDPVLKT